MKFIKIKELIKVGYTFAATLLPQLESKDSTIQATGNEETCRCNDRQPKIHIYISPNTLNKHFNYF